MCVVSLDSDHLQHADGALGDFAKHYFPVTRAIPGAKQLCDKHLKEVSKARVEAMKRKIDSAAMSITTDESPDVLRVTAVNTLFTHFNAEGNEKAVHLDVAQVK